jgi:hypothetical protein
LSKFFVSIVDRSCDPEKMAPIISGHARTSLIDVLELGELEPRVMPGKRVVPRAGELEQLGAYDAATGAFAPFDLPANPPSTWTSTNVVTGIALPSGGMMAAVTRCWNMEFIG